MSTLSPANASQFDSIASLIANKHEASSVPLWMQSILIFGEYGSGKSTLAASFEDHAFHDTQNGAVSIDHTPSAAANTWDSFVEWVESIYAYARSGEKLPFRTIIVDPVGPLFDQCKARIFAEHGWKDEDDANVNGSVGKGWTEPRREFKRVIAKLLELQKLGACGVVFVAHEKEKEQKVGLTYKAMVALPDTHDNAIDTWLAGEVQIVLRACKTNVNPTDSSDVWDQRRFILQSAAGESFASVKDRSNRLPAYLPTSFKALEAAYNKPTKKAAPAAQNNGDN